MRYKIFIPVLVIAVMCVGCTPEYINDKHNSSTADILPSTYVDTQMKINQVCNNIIVSSSTLQIKLARYLEESVEISIDDKNSMISDINTLTKAIRTQKSYLTSFKPHSSLTGRVAEIETNFINYESILRTLKTSIENNNYTDMKNNKSRLKSVDDSLKSLSIT